MQSLSSAILWPVKAEYTSNVENQLPLLGPMLNWFDRIWQKVRLFWRRECLGMGSKLLLAMVNCSTWVNWCVEHSKHLSKTRYSKKAVQTSNGLSGATMICCTSIKPFHNLCIVNAAGTATQRFGRSGWVESQFHPSAFMRNLWAAMKHTRIDQ